MLWGIPIILNLFNPVYQQAEHYSLFMYDRKECIKIVGSNSYPILCMSVTADESQ